MSSSLKPLPLDENLYLLDDEALAFFKAQTGIHDAAELKEHILAVQKRAYKIHPYPCIHNFGFTWLGVTWLPSYERILRELYIERPGAIFVDVGCGLGQDLRKLASDGWPVGNLIAVDVEEAFWNYGHELFRSTAETFPAKLIVGDIFSPSTIVPRAPFDNVFHSPRPDLLSLSSLTPLQGFASAVHAFMFFHLFDEEKQLLAARQLASLLSPLPGSIIFGAHAGSKVKGLVTIRYNGLCKPLFCHSVDSWQEIWDGQVFPKGKVHVDACIMDCKQLGQTEAQVAMLDGYFLVWSVTRL